MNIVCKMRLSVFIITVLVTLPILAYDFEVDGIYYNKLSGKEVEVTYKTASDRGYSGQLKIPKTVYYNGVTYNVIAIGKGAFFDCNELIGSLEIPNSVKSIGMSAFYNCSGFTGSLMIPNSVTSIGETAFYNCSGFTGSLTIPNSVTSIGDEAFSGCRGFTGSLTLSNSLKSIGKWAFYYCSGFTGLLAIPNSVTAIGDYAFYGCRGFTGSLTIPSSVTSIGNSAFSGCSGFTGSLTIPSSVTTIAYSAFSGCSGFTGSLTIPNSVTSIGVYAFYNCSGFTGSLTIPSTVTAIGDHAFSGCSGFTGSLTIPSSVTTIANSVFSGCSGFTGSLTIPNSVTSIANSAFSGCSGFTGSLTIPSSVTTIANFAFSGCSGFTGSLTIPSSVTTIANSAFSGCSGFTGSLTIPNSVTSIGEYAFYKCSGFTGPLNIPNSVCSIGKGAFMRCNHVERVNSEILSPFTIPENVFFLMSSQTVLQVPKGTKSKYEAFPGWTKYFKEIVEGENLNPVTTYSLSITASGNGSVTYNSTAVRNKTQSFTVSEGTSATVSITPDNGYKVASLYVNNINMISSIANNSYTINNISKNTTVEVTFEAIPVTTYSLSITASGNGSVTYNSTAVRNKTQSFTVSEGTSATVSITPDKGYKIASLYVNNINMTSGITDNSYIINNISKNTTVEVTFEAIPVTTYSLSITASGNGSVTYNSTAVRNKTQSFTVDEGTSATVFITPDNGYKIASLYVNNINMISSIANNSYTVSNIKKNTTITVSFEVETPSYDITQYVSAISIGGAYTQTNDLINSGSQLNWQFTNKSAYSVTLKSMQLIDGKSGKGGNIMNVDKQVAAGSSVSYSTTIGVLGIYLPVTCRFKYEYNNVEYSTDAVFAGSSKCTMSIKSTGNGSVRYSGMTVRNETKTFTVDHLSSVTITFSPDSGNRLKSVKVNNKDVTSSVSNNSYTERFVTGNLDVEVEFVTIQATTLNITVSGNGSITYNKTVVRDETQSFSVNEGDNATILFSPDKGYNIKNVKMNNNDITAEISNNSYTVKNITDLVVLNVQFESLVDSLGHESTTLQVQLGRARSRQDELKLRLSNLSIEYKDNADAVKQISQLKSNLNNITSRITGLEDRIDSFKESLRSYSEAFKELEEIKRDKEELEEIKRDLDALLGELDEVEKEIDELVNSQPFVCDGVSFMHVPNDEQKVVVSTGDYGHVLRVPATVTQNGATWTVAGIETDALKDNTELAAVVWEPSVAFTATVSNPNLLLYVKSANYAPAAIKNVVVNGVANSITLTDAASGNSFYCAQSFTARTISYQHTYGMTTGIGESRGWETISLPFDVQNISHKTKGDIVPFAQWNGGEAVKPFWLYELTGIGFVEASNIKANTPYIISMPNNGRYDSQWQLSGTVTFSASNVVVDETENLHTTFYLDRTFVPNFTEKGASEGLYALNVNNDYSTDNSGMPEGSKFVLNMRPVHPFEAYMTTASNARQMIDIFEGMTTEITGIYEIPSEKGPTYDLQGRKVAGVKKGVYIKDGRKVIIK